MCSPHLSLSNAIRKGETKSFGACWFWGSAFHSSSILSQVSLAFSKSEVKPGQKASLRVKAEPRSRVFLLGVDKSARLLGTGNDITRDNVSEHSDCTFCFIHL